MRKTRLGTRWLAALLVILLQPVTNPSTLQAAPSGGSADQLTHTNSYGHAPSPAQPLIPGPVALPTLPPEPILPPPAPGETDRPVVRLEQSNQPFRGIVTIHAKADGLKPQHRLTFQLNSTRLDAGPGRPTTLVLDTREFADGIYDLLVLVEGEDQPLAWDRQRVTIDNTPPEVIRADVETDLLVGESGILEVDTTDHWSDVLEVQLVLPDRVLPMQRRHGGRFTVSLPPLGADTPYQVTVVDASGNRRAWPAEGQALLRVYSRPEAAEVPSTEEPSGSASLDSAELTSSTQETITTLATGTTVGGTLSADTTWSLTGSPYLVTSSVTVGAGITLTVEPGVVVKFAPSTYLNVKGTLRAEGLAERPIIFTSSKDDSYGGDTNGDSTTTVPASGDWYYVVAGAGGTVLLSDAEVIFAGGSYGTAALYGNGGLIQADAVTVKYSKYKGVQLSGGSLTNSVLADVASIGIHVVSGDATVSGNSISSTSYGIQVDTGSPSLIGNQIAPNANTTGIYLNGGTPTVDGNTIIGRKYGIYYNGGAPRIQRNQISSSASVGIYLYPNKADLAVTLLGNTITGGVWALYISFYSRGITSLQSGENLFTGNQYNGYGVGGTFKGTATLPVLDYAYVANGLQVAVGATLEIPAGVVLKVPAGASALVANGTVNLNGTASDPVIVTSVKDDSVGSDTNGDGATTTPSAGDWAYIQSATGATINATYTAIRYGGKSYAALYSSGGLIQADHLTVEQSLNRGVQLTGGRVTNSTFDYISTTAIYVASGSPEVLANTVNSANYGLYVNAGSPTVIGNTIHSQAYGVYVYQGAPVIRENIVQAGDYGVYVYSYPGLSQPEVTGNTLTGISTAAFYHAAYSRSMTGMTLTDNTFANSSSAVIFSFDQAGFGTNVIGSNSFVGNQYNGYCPAPGRFGQIARFFAATRALS